MQALRSFFNKLCVVERRKLSDGEKKIAQGIFADQLKLEQIELVAHRLILPHYAMSPNGNVYFNPQDYCLDFSVASIDKQAWLMHELTHVWQIQQGVALLRKAVFDRRYAYVLEQGKQFVHYGVEQQAQMVQDYFLQLQLGQDCAALAACLPFLAQHTDQNSSAIRKDG